MDWLVWSGALISAIGLCGIIYSLVTVTRAKRAGLADEDLRAKLAKILPINLGALFLSTIGLMMVIVGVILA